MEKEVEKIIRDIIINEMALDPTRVWIDDQNFPIPADNDLFITVGFLDGTPMSNNKFLETDADTGSTYEIQTSTQFENVQINLISRDTSARTRRFEALLALTSIYSEQQQEKYGFKIFRIPANFAKISEVEGGSSLNRYVITIVCQTYTRKANLLTETSGKYYETFPTRVDTEDTIGETDGAIEFTLTD